MASVGCEPRGPTTWWSSPPPRGPVSRWPSLRARRPSRATPPPGASFFGAAARATVRAGAALLDRRRSGEFGDCSAATDHRVGCWGAMQLACSPAQNVGRATSRSSILTCHSYRVGRHRCASPVPKITKQEYHYETTHENPAADRPTTASRPARMTTATGLAADWQLRR